MMSLTEEQIIRYLKVKQSFETTKAAFEYAKMHRLSPAKVQQAEAKYQDAKLDLTIIKQELKIM